MAEEIIDTEVLFEYHMVDSTFRLEKAGNSYAIKEVMYDGTEVFREDVYQGKRLATVLNRIATQNID